MLGSFHLGQTLNIGEKHIYSFSAVCFIYNIVNKQSQ
uniref:Uncharacterized protein n=1 Tax=Anguilla anguilla TaxID=7936 RepID=A0A0E9S9J7_ANGAN